jgi:hypothetical protein
MTERVSILGAGEEATEVLETQELLGDVKPGSILWRLKEQAKQLQQEHEIDLSVGGEFGDWLMIRYKVMDPDRLDVIYSRIQNEDNPKALQANMDFMAQACVAVVGHNPETGDKEVLKHPDGRPMVIEQALIKLLEMPIPPGPELTARDVIALLFSRNGVAIGQHGNKLVRWMQDPSKKLDLGEESTLS